MKYYKVLLQKIKNVTKLIRNKKKSKLQIYSGCFCKCDICGHQGYVYSSKNDSFIVCHVCGLSGGLRKIPIDACGCKTCRLEAKWNL